MPIILDAEHAYLSQPTTSPKHERLSIPLSFSRTSPKISLSHDLESRLPHHSSSTFFIIQNRYPPFPPSCRYLETVYQLLWHRRGCPLLHLQLHGAVQQLAELQLHPTSGPAICVGLSSAGGAEDLFSSGLDAEDLLPSGFFTGFCSVASGAVQHYLEALEILVVVKGVCCVLVKLG